MNKYNWKYIYKFIGFDWHARDHLENCKARESHARQETKVERQKLSLRKIVYRQH